MIIYQMLPRLWGDGTLQQIDDQCLDYFKTLGITHVWYMLYNAVLVSAV